MRRWLLGATLLIVVGVLSGCGQDELRKEKAALASSSARLESRASVLDARESSLDKVRASTESSSIAESESQAIAESESQEKADSQASSASAAFSSQAESVSAAAESISQNQISSPVQAVDWVKQQRGEQDGHGKITWQASTTGEKDGQHYFVVQGRREDGKVDDALDLIVLSTGEIMTRDSTAGKALVE